MRVWDVPVAVLTDKHLLGEHREVHGMWTVLARGCTGGYSKHPETLRWRGHMRALHARHEAQVEEMTRRGFNHQSPLSDPPDDSAEWPSITIEGSIPVEARDLIGQEE